MTYFISLFFGTFVLEDLALASALALVAENKISFTLAFWACFLGISIGDLALYGLGLATKQFNLEKKFKFLQRHHASLEKMRNSRLLTYTIVASRFIPGTRLLTYLGSGFVGYSFWRFFILTVASVFIWVIAALAAGKTLQTLFMNHWVIGLFAFLVMLNIFKIITTNLSDRWRRKALIHSWRRWAHFEFWPAWLFYIPIVFDYIYLSIRFRSVFMPFYASPQLKHGGLIGESKWDFLRHLDANSPATLPSFKLPAGPHFSDIRKLIDQNHLDYPLIMKPDVGQRGFGVRILKNDFDLTEYLLLSDFDCILQKKSQFEKEAGLFYIRRPEEKTGIIFSLTDKIFPSVIGDGISPLGDLILKDKRARIISQVYFNRLKEELNFIPEIGQKVALSECGNHCQGAIFLNGQDLITPELTRELDRIAHRLPHFYFGRFDVRYRDKESLMRGQFFEIVEVNGSGSEATHIWDPNTRMTEAYRVLFQQWKILFEIGDELQSASPLKSKVRVFDFLRECAKVFFRKSSFSVSS